MASKSIRRSPTSHVALNGNILVVRFSELQVLFLSHVEEDLFDGQLQTYTLAEPSLFTNAACKHYLVSTTSAEDS